MVSVQPAPCLLGKTDMSIGETLELMREQKTSYILLQGNTGGISGIFTDRDVLHKFPALMDSKNLERPISTLMSRPVKTLPLNMIHLVGEFMVQNNIRHVPIMSKSQGGELVGVVTSKAVFEAMVRLRGMPPIFGETSQDQGRRLLGILSPDGSTYNTFEKIFDQSHHIDVQRIYFANMQTKGELHRACEACDALIIDIDEAPVKEWVDIVKQFILEPGLEIVCLVYSREKHKPEVLKVVETLEGSGQAIIHQKPMDMAQILLELEGSWS